ncbi:lytic exoenzyme target recognition domain-containing protein [Streptococcus pluranimalium]|uniref:lytic exoenzyme target recognition domain-containing protein n=1 Tax=Streptococcus pluranimalium TaxID=82348 RepID=UPI003F66C2BC
MVKKINKTLMSVGKMPSIKGVVIHNDAGTMTAEQYVNWLIPRNKALGIAHYYIDRNTIARVVDKHSIAWHTGHQTGNNHYIGYEVCQSASASDADFLANEDMTLMQATEDLLFYGLPINKNTVMLHREFVPTACPHRSIALHGNTVAQLKDYFIKRMQYFATLGKTVDEMLTKNKKATKVAKRVYRADDVKFIHGIYQIKCDYLVPVAFDWKQNGIPVALVNWVDKNGKNITDGKDKDFKKGMYFTFEGDETTIKDTGYGDKGDGGYYWRKFVFGKLGEVWLSAWDKNHLVNGTQ